MCANHILEVAKFFRGIHLRIDARNEDDIDTSEIYEKLRKSPACKFSFNERSVIENTGPVGTNYKRIEPQREINTREREKFWLKQQEEETKRRLEEKKSLEEARRKREQEINDQEALNAKAREAMIEEKEAELQKLREAKKNAENAENLKSEQVINNQSEDEVRQTSENLRRARKEEAQLLISKSSVRKTRAIFEQNTSAGQLALLRDEKEAEEKKKKLEESEKKKEDKSQEEVNYQATSLSTAHDTAMPVVNVVCDDDEADNECDEEEDTDGNPDDEIVYHDDVGWSNDLDKYESSTYYPVKCVFSDRLEEIAEEVEGWCVEVVFCFSFI